MRIPPFYSLFCLIVLGVFVYAKYNGLEAFNAGAASEDHGGGGSHASGVYLGAHK